MQTGLFVTRDCHFSPCRTYRYSLLVQWNPNIAEQVFICLNPSTADEQNDDPTVRRCIDYSRRWGAGGFRMLNLFAFRATDPKEMIKAATRKVAAVDPIGPENTLEFLVSTCGQSFLPPVAAWGNNGAFMGRDKQLLEAIPNLHCLRVTKQGQPEHPLYLPKSAVPVTYRG